MQRLLLEKLALWLNFVRQHPSTTFLGAGWIGQTLQFKGVYEKKSIKLSGSQGSSALEGEHRDATVFCAACVQ